MRNGRKVGARRDGNQPRIIAPLESLEERLLLAATDPYEPNNTAQSPTDLSNLSSNWLSEMQGNAITGGNDVDWYKIEVSGSQDRHVRLYFRSATAGTRLTVTLYDGSGASAIGAPHAVQVPVSTSPTSRDPSIDLGLMAPGTYTLKVVNAAGAASATAVTYDMKWEAIFPADDAYEPNNSQLQAHNLAGSAGTWLTQLQGPGTQFDEDTYQFYVPPTYTRLAVELMFDDAQGNLGLGLSDASGTPITTVDTRNDGESMVVTVSQPGWYVVSVLGPNLGTPYDLRWTPLPNIDPYGNTGTKETSQDLSTFKGIPLTEANGWGVINGSGQDWYRIPITADALHLSVTTSSMPGGTTEVDTLTTTPAGQVNRITTGAVAATGGTFTVTVAGQTTGAIAYNATAQQIQAAVEALSTVGAGKVTSTLVGGGLTSPSGTCTLSFASSLAVLAVTADFAALTGADPAPTLTEPTHYGTVTGGTFTITVDNVTTAAIAYNASANDIRLALEALSNVDPGDVTVTGSTLDASAIVMSFGSRNGLGDRAVSITTTGLTGGGTITRTETTKGVFPPVRLTLYSSDGTSIAATGYDTVATSVDGNLEADLWLAGTYYVKVTGQADQVYDLTWNSYPKEDTYGDNDYPQTAYDLGNATSGSLGELLGPGVAADSDYYRLATSSDRPNLFIENTFNPELGNVNLELLAPDGTSLAYAGAYEVERLSPSTVSQVVRLTAAAVAATDGSYTITVGGQTTSALAHDATAATIQAAVEALSTVGAGKVTAVDAGGGLGANGGTCTLTFAPMLGALNVSGTFTGLTGSAHTLANTPGSFVSGGTFTITVDGQTTSPIAYNATAADIQAAVEALNNVLPNDVLVTGGPINTTAVVLSFSENLGLKDVAVSINAAGITGGGTITSTETTKGAIPLNQVQFTATGSRIWGRLPQSVLTAGYLYIQISGGNGGNTYDLAWQSAGPGDDAYESNDTLATARALSASQPSLNDVSGIGVQKDDDWYSIPVSPAQSRVYITAGFDTNLAGITVELVENNGTPGGRVLAVAQAIENGSSLSFTVPGSTLATGRAYVHISGANAGNLYDLTWSTGPATDAYGDNSSATGAYDLGSDTTGSLSGDSGQAVLGDADYYRLGLTSDRPTLLLEGLFNSDLGDLVLDLFGPDEVTTLAPNTEVIRLTAAATAATGGTFTLTVGGQTTAPLAHNATAAAIQAAVVALSTVGAGNVTAVDDGGLGFPTGTCTLTFARALGALDITGDFTGLTGNAPTLTEETRGGIITGGTFTITVNGQTTAAIAYNASAVDIRLALEALSNVDPGDVAVTGGPINTAAVVLRFAGQLTLQNVAVSVAVGDLIGGAIAATETNAGGVQLASGPQILEYLFPGVLAEGYCYVRVSGATAGIPYDLTWKSGLGGDFYDDAFEGASGNESTATAHDLSATKGQWLSDVTGLGVQQEDDIYRLPVAAAQPRMTVEVRHDLSVDPHDFSVQFVDAAGAPLTTGGRTSGGTAVWAVMPPSVIKAGYVYVLVNSGNGDPAGTAYDLKWDSAVADDAYGAKAGSTSYSESDAMATAYPLPAGQGWLSEITGKGPANSRDNDYYRLALTAGQPRVNIEAKALAFLGTVSISLYRADGTLLGQSQATAGGAILSTVVPAGVMSDGYCYILITSDTRPGTPTGILYDLRYRTSAADDSFEPNDVRETATDISSRETTSISAISGDDDWYSITVPAAARSLRASASSDTDWPMTFSLYDGAGTLLTSSPSFSGRAGLNYNLPQAGTYLVKVQMDQAGVPYSLQWDVQEAASRVTIGAGGVNSAKFTDADGTRVTITAAGAPVVLDFAGGDLASTTSAGVVTVAGDAGTVRLDRIDLSSATRATRITVTTIGGDGRVTVNSIVGDAIVGSFYAPTMDLVGEGISMIGDGAISQLTLGTMAADTALIMPGPGLPTGMTITAGLFSGNMIAALGSPISSLSLGAWVGRGSTMTGQAISRLNITGLSSVGSLPAGLVGDDGAKIAAGAMEADLLMIGRDALGKSIGTATVAGNARGTWDVSGNGTGDIGSIRLNGPQNDWSLLATTSRVTSLSIRGDLTQNSLSAKVFNSLTIQGNASLATLEAWQFGVVTIYGDFVDSSLFADGHVPDSTDNAPYGGVVKSLTIRGDMTDSTLATQQITTLLVTGDLDSSEITASGHKSSNFRDINLIGRLGTVTVNGNISASTLTAGHDSTGAGDNPVAGQIGTMLIGGNITSSTLAVEGAATLSDDRTHTGLSLLRAGRVSDSNMTIAGGAGVINIIEWLDGQSPADTLKAGWVRSLTTRGAAAVGSTPASTGDFQADLDIGDYVQSVNVRGEYSAGISIDYVRPPLAGSALNRLVAGTIKDTSIVINGVGGINSISTSEWIDTGVSDLIYAKTVNSIITTRGNFEANLEIGDYINLLSVRGWLSESAVHAQNLIRSVVVGGAKNSTVFAGSFMGEDTVGAGGAADNVFDLPTTNDVWAAQTPSGSVQVPGLGRLVRLTVTGAVKDGEYSFINTNIAAITMDSVRIIHPDESPNAVVFGLVGDTISSLSILDSHGWHAWTSLRSPGQDPSPLNKLEIRIA